MDVSYIEKAQNSMKFQLWISYIAESHQEKRHEEYKAFI